MKYVIRYCFLHNGERVRPYYVATGNSVRDYTSRTGPVIRSNSIHDAQLFDKREHAELMLKDPGVKAGMAKIIGFTDKEIFKLRLQGK
jgi:hypothetical protein